MKVLSWISYGLNITLVLLILAIIYVSPVNGWFFKLNPEGFLKGIDEAWGFTTGGVYVDHKDGTLINNLLRLS